MKRGTLVKLVKLIAIPAVLFATGAGFGPFLPEQFRQFISFRSPNSMNVGVVKIAPVLEAQWRRMLASDNPDPRFQAFQAKARAMQQKMDANKCRYSNELENLKAEYAGSLAKWHEQRKLEIERSTKHVAEKYGYQLIYCEASEVEHWPGLQCNLSQHMNNGWKPACFLPSVDVTQQVIEIMQRLDEEKKSSAVP